MLLETDHTGGFMGAGVSFVDFNDDGFDDLTFAHYSGEIRFYVGDGDSFGEVNMAIDNEGAESKGLAWVDFDNDSDLDLFVANRLAPNKVWRNDDGVLIDISSSCGIDQSSSTRSYGISFGDFDNNGFVDLYICNYHTWIDSKENELYMNNGDGTFSDVTEFSGVGNGFQQSFQATWIDINYDGFVDLHVINDRVDMYNAFYINNGDGTFTDLAPGLGADLGIYAMSSTFGDFDRDGDMDLYVTNGSDGNILLENQLFEASATFLDVTLNYSVGEYELCWGADWIDYDNDSWPDLYVSSGINVYTNYPEILGDFPEITNSMYLNNGSAPFFQGSNVIPTTPQHTFAIAQGDYNNDGFPDLISHKLGEYATLLKGSPNNNNWVKVKLKGVESNSYGVGCEIVVTHITPTGESVELLDVVFAGENYLGQNSYWQHFGLANSDSIESITVYWTGGAQEVFVGPYDVNQSIVLVEGSSTNADNQIVDGCTYPNACNYNVNSSYDDGLCDFSCLCGDGTVWDISSEKCVGYIECPTDINQSGSTEVGDLLMILAEYGAMCSD
jgi:hypothetical protein